MGMTLKAIRRVVTGNDAQGRSRVLFDGPAPNVNPGAVAASAAMTDLWVFQRCPAPISGERDDGNLPFNFEPPHAGGPVGQTLAVDYGSLETPDLFKDGAEVVVEGELETRGGETVFVARNVMAKGPSKFQAQTAPADEASIQL